MANPPLLIDIRHPMLLKAGDLVLLTREDGDVPGDEPGFGLFYRDTCYLGAYRLRLGGAEPLLLMSSAEEGIAARVDLTNPEISAADGRTVDGHGLGLRRTFLVQDDTFVDVIRVRNFGTGRVVLPVALTFATRFESTFILRGTPPGRRGRMHAPSWDGKALRFAYEGADDVLRTLTATFSLPAVVAPRTTEGCAAHFELALDPGAGLTLAVACRVDERPVGARPPAPPRVPRDPEAARRKAVAALLDGCARIEATGGGLGKAVTRSLSDIALLDVRRGEHRFTAAGLPWFVGLFGRDSLLPTIQCIAFNPDLAACTTKALAHWQGTKDDARTGEQPGKILHELRVGEMAHLGEVPQTPSYEAVDATLLFLIAIGHHAEWTGSLDLFRALRPNVDRALAWLDRKAAENGAGYVAYDGLAKGDQPVNQSWRDSGNGVLRADGAYPVPPLALVEVQGYAYRARKLIARLLRRAGEGVAADRLDAAAEALKARFLKDFWMEDEGCYCLALERGGRQVASVASNAAQVLWTGIASPKHAARVAERVMRPDMFSGWGVRTLSTDHPRFAPFAYADDGIGCYSG